MIVFTDYGQKEIKQLKTFEYKNHKFVIAELPVKSLQGKTLRKCVHVSTGKQLPFTFCKESTVQSYIDTSLLKLEGLEKRFGFKLFSAELEKHKTINL